MGGKHSGVCGLGWTRSVVNAPDCANVRFIFAYHRLRPESEYCHSLLERVTSVLMSYRFNVLTIRERESSCTLKKEDT